jgi:hypothetical protein
MICVKKKLVNPIIIFNEKISMVSRGHRGRDSKELQLPVQSVPITTKVVFSEYVGFLYQ